MQRHLFKVLACASVAGGVAGCAPILPPAVMIVSQAIDGISYITTGKSGTDHILSAALEEDCAIHRIVTGGAVCQAETSGNIAATSVSEESAGLSVDEGGAEAIGENPHFAEEPETAGNDSTTAPRPGEDSVLPGAPPPASDEAGDENLARVPDPAEDEASDAASPRAAPVYRPADDDSAALPILPPTVGSIA